MFMLIGLHLAIVVLSRTATIETIISVEVVATKRIMRKNKLTVYFNTSEHMDTVF